jgi:predicted nucleic acid-binding protein
MTHGLDTGFLIAAEIIEHADHTAARALLAGLLDVGDRLALAPQVLAEFMHVVTDPRRFARPLDMIAAWRVALEWWTAREIDHAFPNDGATQLFLQWVEQHRLGRKRLLDTQLAATYRNAGVTSLLTTNPGDFEIFGMFTCLTPAFTFGG